MLYLIDANSLINLYRYIYRVSDSKEDISRFFDEKVENGQVIILESIHEEAIRHESLLFSEMIPILESDPHLLEKSEMYPHERVTSDLSSVLLTDSGKRYKRNKPFAFEQAKSKFMSQGDIQLIMSALNRIEDSVQCTVVSEESKRGDGKYFKKIPLICDHYKLHMKNLEKYLKIEGVEILWI